VRFQALGQKVLLGFVSHKFNTEINKLFFGKTSGDSEKNCNKTSRMRNFFQMGVLYPGSELLMKP